MFSVFDDTLQIRFLSVFYTFFPFFCSYKWGENEVPLKSYKEKSQTSLDYPRLETASPLEIHHERTTSSLQPHRNSYSITVYYRVYKHKVSFSKSPSPFGSLAPSNIFRHLFYIQFIYGYGMPSTFSYCKNTLNKSPLYFVYVRLELK